MNTDPLLNLFDGGDIALLLAGAALLVGLIALWLVAGTKRTADQDLDRLRQTIGTMGRELDEIRVSQFHAPERETMALPGQEAAATRYRAEKSAYDLIWPQLWFLHERLGMFLRAVEAGEPAGELRLEARNAALDARTLLNRNRPFCCEPCGRVDDPAHRHRDQGAFGSMSASGPAQGSIRFAFRSRTPGVARKVSQPLRRRSPGPDEPPGSGHSDPGHQRQLSLMRKPTFITTW